MSVHPPKLKSGDTIGVVSPGRWLDDARLDVAARALEDAGFRIRVADQNRLRDGPFAGPDADRAQAVERMFSDPDVAAILCARGGYGALRIVDRLDYGVVRDNPKIFVGYSDITCLLLAIHRHAGLTTFHGPMLVDMDGTPNAPGLAHLIGTLTAADVGAASKHMTAALRVLKPGVGEGPLIGGNLTILANLIGTSSDVDTAGAILFLEDVDEYLYNIDRMLVHLKRAGKLDGLAGLVLGSFTDLKDNDTPFGRTVEQMAIDHCAGRAFPVVAGLPCGHGGNNMTLPIGARARLEAAGGGGVSLALTETPLS